ncbi:hypothetical protein FEM48_Zijuj06G0196900 [Ziziphus jujuba var. spinosa]|uniref:DUF7912 domain-containing protein n=1 Tax=Ziziphus jujuba var. spinosa TaxID=714518 RepID=A0A978VB88_ZIZJJ|nr:hypothetical protein FEM48_Zijuj06G0196900 [Ziziphus jujuba var. spinosa]
MNVFISWNSRASAISFSQPSFTTTTTSHFQRPSLSSPRKFILPFWAYPFPYFPNKSHHILHARKNRRSEPDHHQPLLKPTIIQEVSEDDEEDDVFLDEYEDEESLDDVDGYFEDEYVADDAELYAGDGAGGGGISLAGTWWDKKALEIAEEVSLSFDGELKIYAFKTLSNSTIQVRIETLSNKSGSPSMEDIEAFSRTYQARTTADLVWQVSSPGVERVVRIPNDLDRFKDRPMYVKYVNKIDETGSSSENDGVFRLLSFDMETECCIWGLADVRKNREKAGKGRPLSKKQREWRLSTPFDYLRLVRLYSEI